MDIGGTNCRMAVVTATGEIVARARTSCRIQAGLPVFLEMVREEWAKISKIALEAALEVVAVCAAVPGLLDKSGTIISAVNLPPLDGFNLRLWLESLSGLPAVVMNDANAAALAEKSCGAGRPFSSLLHITLGTGVGSGLILDNRLWRGVDGVAAEFGHVTVEPEGLLCLCGNRGCLQQYVSAPALANFAKEQLNLGVSSALAGIASLTAADLAAAAIRGDQLALACFGRVGRYLGIACAATVNLLNIEAIIIGGGVGGSFELLEPAIRREIDARALQLPAARLQLLKGELGDDAGIIGAAAAAFSLPSSV